MWAVASRLRRSLCFSSAGKAMAAVGAGPQIRCSGRVEAWLEAALTKQRPEVVVVVRGQRELSAVACSERPGGAHGEVVVSWKTRWRREEAKK